MSGRWWTLRVVTLAVVASLAGAGVRQRHRSRGGTGSGDLEQSRFTAPFAKDVPPYPTTTIAGPDSATPPSVRRAQEWFTSSAGKVMLRDVVVDERDARTRVVHIEFRGV